MTLKSAPPNKAKQEAQLDNLECSKLSQTNGPWLYGIGTAIYRNKAATKYRDCMAQRGYEVERQETNAPAPPQPPAPVARAPVPPIPPPAAPTASPAPAQPAVSTSTAAPPAAAADRLKKLDELHKAGLLTQDEYDKKRQEVLATL